MKCLTLGRYAWLLSAVTPLADPVPAKGMLGLWEWNTSGVVLPEVRRW